MSVEKLLDSSMTRLQVLVDIAIHSSLPCCDSSDEGGVVVEHSRRLKILKNQMSIAFGKHTKSYIRLQREQVEHITD